MLASMKHLSGFIPEAPDSPNRPYLHTLGPHVRITYILGGLNCWETTHASVNIESQAFSLRFIAASACHSGRNIGNLPKGSLLVLFWAIY